MSIKDSDGVVVLGNDSSNPLNNVTIRTPAVPNGSLEVFQGVPGNLGTKILDLDENKIGINTETLETTLNQNVLGMGQTWQDMAGTRTGQTWYTNTTGRPIQVACYTNNRDMRFQVRENENAATISLSNLYGNSNERAQLPFIVPSGWQYRLDKPKSSSNFYWVELR